MADRCVHCGDELSIMERIRSECWVCQDRISLTASDDKLWEGNET